MGTKLAVVILRDRLRRWWSPAQWEDDHPSERKRRDQPTKSARRGWFSGSSKNDLGPSLDVERDFKRPR